MQNGTDPGLVMTDTYGNDTVLETVKLPDGRERLQVDVVLGGGGGGSIVDVSALATEATLLALKNAVLAQIEIASTLWTDDSGAFYVRRDTVTESNGTVTVAFFTPAGAPATPGSGLRPASGMKDFEITSTAYTASAAGTGYSIGDSLIHALVLETSGAVPAVAASIWINITTGLILGAAPSGANIALQSPLPTGAATSAKQDLIVAGLTAVHDAVVAGGGGGSTPTGTVGAPSTSVVSVQGIQGGRTIQTGVGAFRVSAIKAAAYGTPITIDVGGLIVDETFVGGGSVWTNDRGGQNVHVTNGSIAIRGNQTANILVLFEQRWNNGVIGVGDATLNPGDSASLIQDNVLTEIAAALVLEPVAHVGDYTLYQFDTEFNWFTNSYFGGAAGAGAGQGHGGIILIALDAPVSFTAGQSSTAVIFNLSFNSVGSFYAA